MIFPPNIDDITVLLRFDVTAPYFFGVAMDNINQSKNTDYSLEFILSKALDISEEILRCGGEPRRIEDTVTRICTAYFDCESDIFALPSVIIANIRLSDGTKSTQMRRVNNTTNDLYILDMMNNLSRDVCAKKIAPEDVGHEIEKIKKEKVYPKFLFYIAGLLAAGGFSVFFGGDIKDAAVAAAVGVIITLVNINRFSFANQMIHTLFASFIGASAAQIFVKFGFGTNPDTIMMGTIMLVIPGLAFGNSVRDLLFGDTVSGIIQLVQAVLLAAMVALGYVSSMLIFGGVNS